MNYEEIRDLIEANLSRVNFGLYGIGCPDDWIESAQIKLGVTFPPSYRWWLKNYKGGEIDGDEVFSVYDPLFADIPGGDIVYMNKLSQKGGFSTPAQLVIQTNDQGEDFYIDLRQIDEHGESPVFVNPGARRYADNFLQFLTRKLNE